MAQFDDLVFEKKWNKKLQLVAFFAVLALSFEVLKLLVDIDKKYQLFGIVPQNTAGAQVVEEK